MKIVDGNINYTIKFGIIISIIIIILSIILSYIFSITLYPILKIMWVLIKARFNIK